jgi:hypothetical protein
VGFRVFVDSAYSAADKVYSSLTCAVIEFLVTFAWAAYIHVKYIDFYIFFVLLFDLDNMLKRVHAAEVATV